MTAPANGLTDSADGIDLLPGFAAMLKRELLLAWRSRGEVLQPLVFYAMAASLFPLGVGADPALLARIAPGVIWVCGLLAALLSLARIFAADFTDGTLEQLLLSAYPLPLLVGAKILAHWLTTGLALAVFAPVLALQFNLDAGSTLTLVAGLVLGTPLLSMIGAIAAALTLGARGGSVLVALLVLPLYVPVLIFGAGAVEAAAAGLDFSAHLALLAAGSLAGLVTTPFAAALAVRIALE